MGHWTPTGIDPTDYDDDEWETSGAWVLLCSRPVNLGNPRRLINPSLV